jgi:hypothetical protein
VALLEHQYCHDSPVPRSIDSQLVFTFSGDSEPRRREKARLHSKVVELRRAGCTVYRASERQVSVTIADRTRLMSHGELLRLQIAAD